jgi:hypothetical protein
MVVITAMPNTSIVIIATYIGSIIITHPNPPLPSSISMMMKMMMFMTTAMNIIFIIGRAGKCRKHRRQHGEKEREKESFRPSHVHRQLHVEGFNDAVLREGGAVVHHHGLSASSHDEVVQALILPVDRNPKLYGRDRTSYDVNNTIFQLASEF